MTAMPSPSYLALIGGDVWTPMRKIADATVLVADDTITALGPRAQVELPPGTERLDVTGKIVAPGFIDIHVHGGAGSDFMDATPEAIETVCRHSATGGVTSLLATTCSAPLDRILQVLDVIGAARERHIAGAQVLGAHLEGPFFNPGMKGCHRADWVRNPSFVEVNGLLEKVATVKHITLAPEIEGGLDAARAFSTAGVSVSAGHTLATYNQMVEAIEEGVTHSTHLYCAMSGVIYTPPNRQGGCIEAVLLRDELTTEIIADGVHLPPELMQLPIKAKGVDKVILVTDAMRGAGMPDGPYMFGPQDGYLANVANGRAVMHDGTGYASSVVTMDVCVRNAVRLIRCSLPEALTMASANPARLLGLDERKGVLAVGNDADIVVLNPDLTVHATVAMGRVVYRQ
jgi:N-acetylglucosamine-6-phosphate deacetylase